MEYFLCIVLFCVGLMAVIAKKNLVKIIFGIAIMDYALNMFFILIGYRTGAGIPILHEHGPSSEVMVDPLVQAIVLVTIIIGLAMTILLASIAIRLHEKYGTFDITEYRKLKG